MIPSGKTEILLHCERFEPRSHFKRLSLIVRVNVVLNRTVVVDSDWRFDNLCGNHLQSQSELCHVSWWYYNYYINAWFTGLAKLKAVKVILDLPNYASSTDALKTLGWPTLFQEHLVHRYFTTFKYIHGLVDHKFNILKNSCIHGYNTRLRRNDFRLPLVKRNYEKQRLFLINALRNGTF